VQRRSTLNLPQRWYVRRTVLVVRRVWLLANLRVFSSFVYAYCFKINRIVKFNKLLRALDNVLIQFYRSVHLHF